MSYTGYHRKWMRIRVSGDVPPNRNSTAAVIHRNKIIIFGGYDPLTAELNDFHEFDTDTAQWSSIHASNPPPKMYGHTAVMHDNALYIFGGECSWKSYYNDVYKYNFRINQWKKLKVTGNIPCGRYFHSAVVRGDYMIVFGGNTGTSRLNDVHEFNLISNDWKLIKDAGDGPSPRSEHSACVYDKKMYIFGGYGKKRMRDLWEYNCITRKWQQVTSYGEVPTERRGHSAVVYGHCMYIFGGFVEAYSNEFYELNFKTWVWKKIMTLGNVPRSRGYHKSLVIKDVMYLIGGEGDSKTELLDDAFQFAPQPQSRHIYEDLETNDQTLKEENIQSTVDTKISPEKHKLIQDDSQLPTPIRKKLEQQSTITRSSSSPNLKKTSTPIGRARRGSTGNIQKISPLRYLNSSGSQIVSERKFIEVSRNVDEIIKTVQITRQKKGCALLKIYEQNRFTDVLFVVQGKNICVHRCIVAQCEALEKEIFPSQKNKQGMVVVHLDYVSAQAFQRIIEFLYAGTIDLTEEDGSIYAELIYTANGYELQDLVDSCVAQFENVVTTRNVLSILTDATKYKLSTIKSMCFGFFHRHREEIMKSKDIFKLDQVLMVELLQTVEKQIKYPEYNKPTETRLDLHLQRLYDTKQFSDVILVSIDDKKYPAHVCILTALCGYFEQHFKGNDLKSIDTEVNVLVTGRCLDTVLKFIYRKKVKLPSDYEILTELRKFSEHTTLMKPLDIMINEKLSEIVNSKTAVEILQYCMQVKSDDQKLIDQCWKVINDIDKKQLVLDTIETYITRAKAFKEALEKKGLECEKIQAELTQQLYQQQQVIEEQQEMIETQRKELENLKLQAQVQGSVKYL